MPTRIIIVRRNCHEFANKLWSDMAIYAYASIVQAPVWNLATFETGVFAPFHRAIARMLGRSAPPAQYTFLPPTIPLEGKFVQRRTMYFFGWLFRNPEGFTRYRKELLTQFGPNSREEARLKRVLKSLPKDHIVIGVHLRTKPFPYFPDGEFLVTPERVREIVDEYLLERGLVPEQVALVLISDQSVPDVFDDFAKYAPGNHERINFFLLSKCSVVIGTNTTFSNLAAWFGDVSHIVTTNEPIDWKYYTSREKYFENAFATFAQETP